MNYDLEEISLMLDDNASTCRLDNQKTVLVIGETKSGKSTLVNYLLGHKVNKNGDVYFDIEGGNDRPFARVNHKLTNQTTYAQVYGPVANSNMYVCDCPDILGGFELNSAIASAASFHRVVSRASISAIILVININSPMASGGQRFYESLATIGKLYGKEISESLVIVFTKASPEDLVSHCVNEIVEIHEKEKINAINDSKRMARVEFAAPIVESIRIAPNKNRAFILNLRAGTNLKNEDLWKSIEKVSQYKKINLNLEQYNDKFVAFNEFIKDKILQAQKFHRELAQFPISAFLESENEYRAQILQQQDKLSLRTSKASSLNNDSQNERMVGALSNLEVAREKVRNYSREINQKKLELSALEAYPDLSMKESQKEIIHAHIARDHELMCRELENEERALSRLKNIKQAIEQGQLVLAKEFMEETNNDIRRFAIELKERGEMFNRVREQYEKLFNNLNKLIDIFIKVNAFYQRNNLLFSASMAGKLALLDSLIYLFDKELATYRSMQTEKQPDYALLAVEVMKGISWQEIKSTNKSKDVPFFEVNWSTGNYKDLDSIKDILYKNKVSHLDLSHLVLSEADIKKIVPWILDANPSSLQMLNLSNTDITDAAALHLLPLFKKASDLKILRLSNNVITDDFVLKLIKETISPNMQLLTFDGNTVTGECVGQLCTFASTNPQISLIDMNGNLIQNMNAVNDISRIGSVIGLGNNRSAHIPLEPEAQLLHTAVRLGDLKLNLDSLRSQMDTQDIAGENVLHIAARAGNVDILRKLIGDNFTNNRDSQVRKAVNKQFNDKGELPVHVAVQSWNLDVLKFFYSAQVDLTQETEKGFTLLHLSVMKRRVDILIWLLNKKLINVNAIAKNGQTALDIAIERTNADNVRLLLFSGLAKLDKVPAYLPTFYSHDREQINKDCLSAIKYRNERRPEPCFKIENLIFAGGGVKGFAYLSALQTLKEKGNLEFDQLNRMAGTSAGAITAALLAVGYTLEELYEIFTELDFTSFLDQNKAFVTQAFYNLKNDAKDGFKRLELSVAGAEEAMKILFNLKILKNTLDENKGFFKGDEFLKWIEKMLKKKIGEHATFLDLAVLHADKPKEYKLLYIIGSNLSTRRECVFSHETTPHVLISDAIRASMSIPFIFNPCRVRTKLPSETELKITQDIFVDGGMLYNYPLELFDADSDPINNRTLGMLTGTSTEIDRYMNSSLEKPIRVAEGNSQEYILTIIDFLLEQQYIKQFTKEHNRLRTIFIPTEVSTIDFKLTVAQRKELTDNSKKTVENYLEDTRTPMKKFKK